MASSAAPQLVEQVARRVSADAKFAGILAVLVEAPSDDAGEFTHVAATHLNNSRRQSALDDFRQSALTTSEVQRLLHRSSAQAVHVLRSRGKLLGRTIGNVTYFPGWQFEAGDLRPDLPALLQALTAFTEDAVAADRVIRLRREDLGDRSLTEVLDDPKRKQLAWNLLFDLGSGH